MLLLHFIPLLRSGLRVIPFHTAGKKERWMLSCNPRDWKAPSPFELFTAAPEETAAPEAAAAQLTSEPSPHRTLLDDHAAPLLHRDPLLAALGARRTLCCWCCAVLHGVRRREPHDSGDLVRRSPRTFTCLALLCVRSDGVLMPSCVCVCVCVRVLITVLTGSVWLLVCA